MRIALVALIALIAHMDLVTRAVKRIDDRRRWCQLIILPKRYSYPLEAYARPRRPTRVACGNSYVVFERPRSRDSPQKYPGTRARTLPARARSLEYPVGLSWRLLFRPTGNAERDRCGTAELCGAGPRGPRARAANSRSFHAVYVERDDDDGLNELSKETP